MIKVETKTFSLDNGWDGSEDRSESDTIESSNDDTSSSSFEDTDSNSTISLDDTRDDITSVDLGVDKSQAFCEAFCDVEHEQKSVMFSQDSPLDSHSVSQEPEEEPLCHSSYNVVNTTEKALTSFERFVFREWPVSQCNDEALEMLLLQLEHGGGFCTDVMKSIDLSTPDNVRFDIQDVLGLLKEKMTDSTINCIEKLTLPNVKELTAGDNIKEILGNFCGILCGENGKINEVVLKIDDIPSTFTAGNLEWVEDFHSHYKLDKITIYPTVDDIYDPTNKRRNKEYKKLYKKLCGKKKPDHSNKTSYLKKRPSPERISNACKRACNETAMAEENSIPDSDTVCKVPNNKSLFTTLWDLWNTDELHDKGITGRGVTIAFLDSGINIAHKAFTGRIIAVNDITCSGNIDLTTDPRGHGTLLASIACGVPFKSIGSIRETVQIPAGVAPEAKIIMYKVTDSTGKADAATITKALRQCLLDKERFGIDIVLLPYGTDHYAYEQADALRALDNHGVLVVTASGDNGKLNKISYPAKSGHTICVGAHDEYGNTTRNTSKGRALDFTAPGASLTGASSVHPTMFTTGGGTLLAAACVAGLLALMIQRARDIAKISYNAKQLLMLKPSVNKLVHDQNIIKEVLRTVSTNSIKHKESEGYGCLQPTNMLLSDYKLLELLYKDVPMPFIKNKVVFL